MSDESRPSQGESLSLEARKFQLEKDKFDYEKSKMPEHLSTEYRECLNTYRLGWDLVLTGARLYLLFQAGLATAFGFLVTHQEVQQTVHLFGNSVKWGILALSLIGLLSGAVALINVLRAYQYHDAVSSRGIVLEKEYGMELLQSLGNVWRGGRVAGMTVSLAMFVILALFWVLGLLQSFGTPSGGCTDFGA